MKLEAKESHKLVVKGHFPLCCLYGIKNSLFQIKNLLKSWRWPTPSFIILNLKIWDHLLNDGINDSLKEGKYCVVIA